ncbi:nucleotidyltransferase family protein [Agromyces sp. NPDC056523]|uniref:nucleotidyltransferase family protein n=1 Tax=Agromyces sp. NPDC056523 TaxID=3345850 RepID=UPI00366E6921
MNGSEVNVPLQVRLRFGHAAIQYLADTIGADLLHIKGVAVDPSLRPGGYSGSDVDVLVRPEHVRELDAAMRRHGWRLYSTFEWGSPFGHAQTYLHDAWGYIDLHRFFPGIRVAPDRAFDRLWADSHEASIAGVGCRVPSEPAQAVLLVLNAARSTKDSKPDVRIAWNEAPPERRSEMQALVADLDAPVAFAAATGTLDRYRGERDFELWRIVSQGGSRTAEWWARVRAAPTFVSALRIVGRAALVNIDHLSHRLGRPPTRTEIVAEFFRRPARALRETWQGIRHAETGR